MTKRRKISKDPTVLWEGPVASREVNHGPKRVPFIKNDRPRPSWHTHYLCQVHELDEARTKRSKFNVIKRKWYITIDGTSRTFIPENEAMDWLLSGPSEGISPVTIINTYEADLLRTIDLT
jgi:hypothetical protein